MTTDATHPSRRSLAAVSGHESRDLLSGLFALNQMLFHPTIWEVLEPLLQQLQSLLGASGCALYLEQEEGVLGLRTATSDPPLALPQQIPLAADISLWSRVRENWMHQHFVSMERQLQQALPTLAGGQRFTIAPLFRPSSPLPPGLLLVCKEGAWNETELLLLNDLASRLAIRLAHQQMKESLEQHQLSSDFLTRLCVEAPDPRQDDLLLRQARFLGVELSQPHVVIVASIASIQGQVSGSHQVMDRVEAWITRTFDPAGKPLSEKALQKLRFWFSQAHCH